MNVSTRILLVVSLVITSVGIVDAAIGREWDLMVIFALTAAIQLVIWLRHGASRIATTIRPDLGHWLESRSEATGEPYEDVLDRAIATFKQGLYADDQRPG